MAAPVSGLQGVRAGWISPATGTSTSAGGPLLQGASQICNACGYPFPSNKSTIGHNIPCKQCGYVGPPNVPQTQRPLPPQQPELQRNATVRFAVPQAAIHQDYPHPSANVASTAFQPILHSTPVEDERVTAEDGCGLEMSRVSHIEVPREHSEPPEQCLRCCFLRESQTPGHQPYAKGEQGGLQPTTAIPIIAINDVQQVPQPNVQNAVSGDLRRWHPETCHRCCSARMPNQTVERDRAVARNAPPIVPTSYRLFDKLEPVTLDGNAGEEGGEGNEFVVLDEKSGKAERWRLLPAARYNLTPPQEANATNLRSRSPVAPGPPQQRLLNIPTPVSGSFLLPPSAAGIQIPQQPDVPRMSERATDSSAVFVRLPDPSLLNPADWTGAQLVQRAALLGLSRRTDKSPAVFVRISTPAGNAALQSAGPQTSGEIPPPVTTSGKLAFQTLQDTGSELRELRRRASDFLNKYRQHLVRTDVNHLLPPHHGTQYGDFLHLRQNQPPEESAVRSSRRSTSMHVGMAQRPAAANEHISQATPYPVFTSGRPPSVSQARKSVTVSTQTGRHRGRSASPRPTDDSQEENPEPATQRVYMKEDRYSQNQRIREDFSSSDSSNNTTEDSDWH